MLLTIIGTGNVATALGNAFLKAGHTIVQVYGRTKSKAQNLAKALNAEAIDDLKKLKHDSDTYLFCVSDDAIEKTAQHLYHSPVRDFIDNKALAEVSVDEVKKHLPQLSDYGAIHYLINHESFQLNETMQETIESIELKNNFI